LILALGHLLPQGAGVGVRHRATLREVGKQKVAPRTPRPHLAGEVGATRRVRVLPPAPPSPASQELHDLSREERER
jgi:hypothetical protein